MPQHVSPAGAAPSSIFPPLEYTPTPARAHLHQFLFSISGIARLVSRRHPERTEGSLFRSFVELLVAWKCALISPRANLPTNSRSAGRKFNSPKASGGRHSILSNTILRTAAAST